MNALTLPDALPYQGGPRMTAEIALLNRSALALAADSAVTLRIGSSSKTYNTAEKIFEFSCNQPIGLMIYNNVEFAGVPLDVIIRKHRTDCNRRFDTSKSAADEFIDYLKDFKKTDDQFRSYFTAILVEAFGKIYEEFFADYRLLPKKRNGRRKPIDIYGGLTRILQQALKEANATPLPNFLDDKSIDDFKKAYSSSVDDAIRISFGRLDPSNEHKSILYEIAFALAKSSKGSDLLTGLVFGGFGDNDLFPTLHYFEIDGIYFDSLKIINRKEVDIDRSGDLAQIVPFAQKEMAERFVYGVDSSFREDMAEFVTKVVDKITETKPRAFSANDKRTIHEEVLKTFHKTLDGLTQYEHRSILDIVNFMSKRELAEMASALVELTSAKRRFSTEQETVGGPIDVAIVSRSEGFIWIRRKHYFDQGANPGFFKRVYGRATGGTNGETG